MSEAGASQGRRREAAGAASGAPSEQWVRSEAGASQGRRREAAGAASGAPSEVQPGLQLPSLTVHLDRARLVRYAGASGDFNPIHWNARVATGVGLPDVIAHGMLTMALAGRIVTDWIGDPSRVLEYGVRFTRPVVVPDPDGVDLDVSAAVAEVDPAAGTARIDITATVGGRTVLGRARATIRLR